MQKYSMKLHLILTFTTQYYDFTFLILKAITSFV